MEETETQADNQRFYHVNTLCACGGSVQLQFIILHTGTVPKTLAYIIHILNHSTCCLTLLNMACKSKLPAIDDKQEEIILKTAENTGEKEEEKKMNRKEETGKNDKEEEEEEE